MMKIVLYNDSYRNQLEDLLIEFSESMYSGKCDVDVFVGYHWAVYLAVKDDTVVGFSAFSIGNYLGFLDDIVTNTYIYVKPEYRTSKAMYLFSIQAGRVSEDLDLPLEHCYASDESKRLSRKLKGRKMYEAYIYDRDEVKREYNRLKSKLNIKE